MPETWHVRPKIDAVLFDLDGTLVETHIDFDAMRATMTRMARQAGVPDDVIASRDILGTVYAAREYLCDGEPYRRAAFARLEEMEVSGCANPVAIDGAAETLAALVTRNVRVAIVTRNCRPVAVRLLADFNLVCDSLLTRDDVPRVKPDPDHLHRALATFDIPPGRAMMVGDHWMDVRAGVDAGCAVTVGFARSRDQAFFAPCPPTHLITNIGEIMSLV